MPQTSAETAAVLAFNERMLAGQAPTDFVLPDRPTDPRKNAGDAAIRWTNYLAIDETDEVRGGFIAMEQRGWLNGEVVPVANYQSPVSEGIVDKRFGMVGMHMLRYLERQWPFAFVVGMGAADRPLPRLLSAGGWKVFPVPFLFRIVRPHRVFRQLRPLHHRPLIGLAANVAAVSGAGWFASELIHAKGMLFRGTPLRVERVGTWGEWADRLWERVRSSCSFAVVRDRATLERLYPLSDERLVAHVFRVRDSVVGWSVCARTAMRDHAYFGNLNVATVFDAVSDPDAAPSLVSTLTRELSDGADLVITNQSHASWLDAFRRAGFAAAPSNYLLAMSRRLVEATRTVRDRLHITRGDGDGRIHLV